MTALLVSSQLLTGCFGGDDNSPAPPVIVVPPPPLPPPPPPPPTTGQASDFGAGFATAFAANPNSDPVDPVMGDIIPITKFANPLDIENP
ncbi:hypothetical protein ACFFUB_06860 [Algimonas porphyrae]|nr:hypothetical protein [Algimonas porphyrae]